MTGPTLKVVGFEMMALYSLGLTIHVYGIILVFMLRVF